MRDRFGLLPEEVLKLFELSKIRLKMREKGIKSIEKRGSYLLVKFIEDFKVDHLYKLMESYKKGIEFDGTEELTLKLKIKTENVVEEIKEFIKLIKFEVSSQ